MTVEVIGNKTYEEIYLTVIHNANDIDKIDLHTYLYHKEFASCPICNEWLIQRSKPEVVK